MNVWFTVIISAIRFFILIDAMKTINFKFYERNFFFSDFLKILALFSRKQTENLTIKIEQKWPRSFP